MLKLSFDLLHYCNYNYIFSKTKCVHITAVDYSNYSIISIHQTIQYLHRLHTVNYCKFAGGIAG